MLIAHGQLLDVYRPAVDFGPFRSVCQMARGRPVRAFVGPVHQTHAPYYHDGATLCLKLRISDDVFWKFEADAVAWEINGKGVIVRVTGDPELRET